MCASLYARGCGGWFLFAEVTRCMLLCMLEEGGLYLLEVMEVMRRALLCMLEATDGRLC